MAEKKKAKSQLSAKEEAWVQMNLKVGDNELNISGPEDYVIRMRDWFLETLELAEKADDDDLPAGNGDNP